MKQGIESNLNGKFILTPNVFIKPEPELNRN